MRCSKNNTGTPFKGFLQFIFAIPAIFLILRGFTLVIGQGTEAFGMVMTDIISIVVFWLFALLSVSYCVVCICRKIQDQLSKGKASKTVTNSQVNKVQASDSRNKNDERNLWAYLSLGIIISSAILLLARHDKGRGKTGGNKYGQTEETTEE